MHSVCVMLDKCNSKSWRLFLHTNIFIYIYFSVWYFSELYKSFFAAVTAVIEAKWIVENIFSDLSLCFFFLSTEHSIHVNRMCFYFCFSLCVSLLFVWMFETGQFGCHSISVALNAIRHCPFFSGFVYLHFTPVF